MTMLSTQREELEAGGAVRVARLGSGPPLVMVHGYPENLQIWCRLAPRLADRFSVTAFDWPGMGYSSPWPGGTTPAHMSRRLIRLLDRWGLDRVDLVALDMGGQPALVAAADHPDRINRLVVMNSLVFGAERTSWEIRVLRKFGLNRLIINHLPRLVFWRALTTFLSWRHRLPAPLRRDFWDAFRRRDVRRFISRMCHGYQGHLARLPDAYARIARPTLVLWGSRDKHFPVAQAERLHRALPGSRLEIVDGAGHWMPWSHAQETASAITSFLTRETDPQ
jgi:pimeloyl-ACP methyl ester carboxylesterase